MNANAVRKQENPLRLVPITRTPDELAQIELIERVNRIRLTGQKPRRAAKLSAGELKPLSLVGRLVDDLLGAGATDADLLQAFVPTLADLIRRKSRKRGRPIYDTGEYGAMAG